MKESRGNLKVALVGQQKKGEKQNAFHPFSLQQFLQTLFQFVLF
jgi:hypothetical protein